MQLNLAQYSFILFLISGFFGLFFNSKKRDIREKLFLVFLFYTVFSELIGVYLYHYKKFELIPNPINIYIYISNLFYLLFIGSLLKSKLSIIITSIFVGVFTLFYFYDYFYLNEIYKVKSYVLGTVFVLIFSTFYLVTVLKSPNIESVSNSLYFWIIIGVLLFVAPFLPYFIYINIFKDKNYYELYSIIVFSLNLIMNLCYIIGFYRSRKNYSF